MDAVNTIPALFSSNVLDLAWSISIDGDLMKKSLRQYISEGNYAKVPTIGGGTDDEGT